GELSGDLNNPFVRWTHALHQCARLCMSGTGDEIEAAALEAFRLGQAAGQSDLLTWFGPQLFAARWSQGRLGELVALTRDAAAGSPGLPAWRAASALAGAAAGERERAAAIVDDLMADPHGVFPENVLWLVGHSVLAEAVAAVGAPDQAAREYDVLLPHAGRVPCLANVARPAISFWLALLAERA